MSFFNNMDSRHKLLIILLPVAVLSILMAYLIDGALTSVLVGIVIIIIAGLSKSVWLPRGYGITRVRILSIGVISLIITTYWLWDALWPSILLGPLLEYLKQQGFNVPGTEGINPMPVEVLVFALIGIFIVNYFTRDKTAMRRAEPVDDEEFPEIGFKQHLEKFAKGLRYSLDSIDHDLDWSDDYFVPLQAEVEVKNRTGKKKKITDLMKALKDNNAEKVLLVLGDPGSGKSVALRKLAKDLTDEVTKTGKVPVYVNLREWSYDDEPGNLKPEDLRSFLFNNVSNRCDVSGKDFMEAYFDKMIEHGRIFFILDSFDEIPFIMDEDESSPVVDHISATIYQFLEISNGTRGLLASRLFRKPTRKFMVSTTLDIRPLSEMQIIKRFEQSPSYDQRLSELLFKHKPEYIPLARNPFMVSLIYSYAKNNNWTLPEARIDLYENYLKSKFEKAKKYIETGEQLKYTDLLYLSSEVASFIYSSDQYGLEVPTEDLKLQFPDRPIDVYIEIMQSIRLARLGRGDKKLFSFAHRRFYEFFIALRLKAHAELVDIESIPTDSKWRDALILYCEVVTDEEAKRIANYCWNIIQEMPDNNDGQKEKGVYLRSVHTLRFLNDAFRSRKAALQDFMDALGRLLINRFDEGDLLVQKLIAESTGVLASKYSETILIRAIGSANSWVSETAIRSCRYQDKPSEPLVNEVKAAIYSNETSPFYFRKINNHIYSYKLADGFKSMLSYVRWLRIEKVLFILSTLLVVLMGDPLNVIAGVTYFVFSRYVFYSMGGYFYVFIAVFLIARSFSHAISGYLESGTGFGVLLVYGVSFLIVIPWSQILQNTKPRSRALKMSGYFIAYALIFTVGPFVIKYLIQMLEAQIERIVGWIFVGVLFSFVLRSLVKDLIPYLKDYVLFSKLSFGSKLSREEIFNTLKLLKTRGGRFKFIRKIEEENINAYGEWPDGELPNYFDNASTLLAQLEERWLGFDR